MNDNHFITNLFREWKAAKPSPKAEVVNRILRKLGFASRLAPPRKTGEMTNVEQRMNMYHLLTQVLAYDVPGAIVELGCHQGQSAMLFRKILTGCGARRELHVYDSFQGIPDPTPEDGTACAQFKRGMMSVSQRALLSGFAKHQLEPPVIHAGWFDATLADGLPDRIAFAHLDGDLYESTKIGLQQVYPRLAKGAVCLIDDYADPAVDNGWNLFPGVKRACDEYLADKPEKVFLLYSGDYSHGYFRKL